MVPYVRQVKRCLVLHGLGERLTTERSRTPNSPKFNSSIIQDYLCEVDDTSPDVLFLYDSCHSANGHGSIESSRSAIALLAACGFESVAAEIGPHSFTYALIQELSDAASHRKPISVPELHSSLLTRLHLQRRDVVLQEKEGKICIRTENSIPLFERPVWRTPIYVQLSRNVRPRPIILAPLPGSASTPGDPDFIDLNVPSASTCKPTQQKRSHIHVLLRVSLAEEDFSVEEFKDWICDAPEHAKEIKIITALPSCSTLILLLVSAEVWDMLPPSPAVSFVGFVTHSERSVGDFTNLKSPDSGGNTRVTFETESEEENFTVALLDFVDSILPSLFREIRQGGVPGDTSPEVWITDRVMDEIERALQLPTIDYAHKAVLLTRVCYESIS